MMKGNGIITPVEKDIAAYCVESAGRKGASAVRVSLSKTVNNGINFLNGKVDSISYSEDRSVFLHLYADGRYGTFSTNRLEKSDLDRFISQALSTVKMLQEDPCRCLPSAGSKAVSCSNGDELELADSKYADITPDMRKEIALEAASRRQESSLWSLESAEDEYSDSLDDNLILDSDGFEGRHTESSYAFCSEVTLKDKKGNLYSGYWWDAAPMWDNLDISKVNGEAVRRAAAKIGSGNISSGKYCIIVDRSCSSRLVGPVLNALDAMSIWQHNSFLEGSMDKSLFCPLFTLSDRPHDHGKAGSRLFDTEGVATSECDIVKNGTIRRYFVNSYMARKSGMAPTVEGISRPVISPHICNCSKKEINLKDIMDFCRDGLYITGFNGGNCNQATGAFSFGVEGIVFRDGQLLYPVREVLLTGNMTDLWKKLVAAGSDPRSCARWQIPTLAFKDMDLSA